jgi:dihydrofolate reductase
MPKITSDLTITLDGCAAGAGQSREHPFGDMDPDRLHAWMFDHAEENTEEKEAFAGCGAYVMGRNMFGPDRGEWDLDWRGWWGPNPPFQVPTFVLGHRPRPSVEMEGGTVYHFVTDGIEAALERARDAAGERDVKIGGGVSTVRQYLQAGLIDELHFALSPVLLGQGEAMFAGLDLPALGYRVVESTASEMATHVVVG